MKRTDSQDLTAIPGVGKNVAQHLADIDIYSVNQLRGQDAEHLYELSNLRAGHQQDRCLLYVFRCAVYYAEGGREPDKLLWWNWQDKKSQ